MAASSRRPVLGADAAARFLAGIVAKLGSGSWHHRYGDYEDTSVTAELVPVNGQTGLLVRIAGQPAAVVALGVIDGRVAEVDLVVNPEKLEAWTLRS